MLNGMQQQGDFKARPANEFKIREMGTQIRLGHLDWRKDRSKSSMKYFHNPKKFNPNIINMEHPCTSHWGLSHNHKIQGAYDSEKVRNYPRHSGETITNNLAVSQKKSHEPTINLKWDGLPISTESEAAQSFSKNSLVNRSKPINFKFEKRDYDIISNYHKRRIGEAYHNKFDFYDPTCSVHSRSHNTSTIAKSRSREFNIITGKHIGYGPC